MTHLNMIFNNISRFMLPKLRVSNLEYVK